MDGIFFITFFGLGLLWSIYSLFKPSDFSKKLNKAIKDVKEERITRSWNFEEFKKEVEEKKIWNQRHPIQAYVKEIYYILRRFIYEIPNLPRYSYRKIKRGIQRAYFGICDEDSWNLCSYLSKVIRRGLSRLYWSNSTFRTSNTGNDKIDYNENKCHQIKGEIIYAFTLNEQILNGERESYMPKLSKKLKKEFNCLTRDENRRRIKGMKLFVTYFFSLWD